MAYTTIDDPSAHFTITLYSGNGSDDRSITNSANAGNFKPDWLWIKQRDQTRVHLLQDSTRGATKYLRSDANSAEATNANGVQAFETNGFQLGTDTDINQNSGTYVAWQWIANGGTTSTNSNGSQNSTVQVNSTAGFSIVKRTGTGSAGATYGHGLGVEPDVIINKGLNSNEWYSYFKAMGAGTHWIGLEADAAKVDDANMWNDTDATSSVFTVGNSGGSNGNTYEYIAYCFHSVQGYSKFGKYTGNGSTNGPFVYTGFKPAWILFKNTGSTTSWRIIDNKRDTRNGAEARLFPDNTDAENTSAVVLDILSNGFKIKTTNGGANTDNVEYIYMAFAEHPFVSSKGVPVTAR